MRGDVIRICMVAGLATVLLTGCLEDTDLHEPGVYKGGADELTKASPQREEALRERGEQAFADR